jgi:ribosomal protein S18 acetylase RimI-like enzyme
MDILVRRSRINDLDLLLQLEQKAFPYFQQSSRRTLDLSLKSAFQQVWFAEVESGDCIEAIGCLIFYMYKKTIRIFSIVVDPNLQGKGIGSALLEKAQNIALEKGSERISLDVYAENKKLINWYKKAGFEATELLTDYYELGLDGMRMVKELPRMASQNRITNNIVVDNPKTVN